MLFASSYTGATAAILIAKTERSGTLTDISEIQSMENAKICLYASQKRAFSLRYPDLAANLLPSKTAKTVLQVYGSSLQSWFLAGRYHPTNATSCMALTVWCRRTLTMVCVSPHSSSAMRGTTRRRGSSPPSRTTAPQPSLTTATRPASVAPSCPYLTYVGITHISYVTPPKCKRLRSNTPIYPPVRSFVKSGDANETGSDGADLL